MRAGVAADDVTPFMQVSDLRPIHESEPADPVTDNEEVAAPVVPLEVFGGESVSANIAVIEGKKHG